MRKIILTVLIVIVAAVVAFFCWRDFVVPDINFVSDYTSSEAVNHFKIQRLYAADVDVDEYIDKLENVITDTEYTEEEMYNAAIASGEPAFFPYFDIDCERENADSKISLDGLVAVELAEKQKEHRLKLSDVSVEAIVSAGDITIDEISVNLRNNSDDEFKPITKINNEKNASFDITDVESFNFQLGGNNGTITLRFVYNVLGDTPLPKVVAEEQLVEVHLTITTTTGGDIEVEYIQEPYSSLEDLALEG